MAILASQLFFGGVSGEFPITSDFWRFWAPIFPLEMDDDV